ncbi:universal stress protein [Jannaschia sp. CCS1]|uniref:universal stress protein n=1 Tax=Jannaschia sp. (strain CCS1) TaxID=290400 RepID=UPI000053D155|nr:universal stress protein [Jannaschia sp. CCS1]ABD55246.1 UspA [Jannaschia sp. CCS1]
MFKTILLPVDLSSPESWSKALPAARDLMASGECVLHVLCVVPDFGLPVVGSFFDEGFEENAMHRVGEALTVWVHDNIPADLNVQPHVTHGRVYDEILRAADKLSADAIVMGAHTPEISDYLLGPNAARVVRHAKQSVFVVRGK